MKTLQPDQVEKTAAHGPEPDAGLEREGCIVCGTDFTAESEQAANAASALAMRLNWLVLLIYSMAETIREQLPENARDTLIPVMRKQLDGEAQRLRALGARVEAVILDGIPTDGIAEFVRGYGNGLLVVGTTRHEIVDRFLTGNVAEVLAESSPVPTMVVRSAAPFEEWARGDRPLRVLVAADLTLVSDAAIRWVKKARQIGPCEVKVVHVIRRPREEAGALLELEEKVKALLGEENVTIEVPRGFRTARRILAIAREQAVDLLVIGSHQRHGLERLRHISVSRALLRHSTASVICVPSLVAAAPTAPLAFPS